MATTWTGTVGAIAADLIAADDLGNDDHVVPGETYIEIWSPIGELRIPRHHLPNHTIGDTITITIGTAE
jgi:hypothetical protein